jgi:hypothetical protein
LVDGDLFYAIVEGGFRLLRWGQPQRAGRGFVDALLGYQYWRESYEAFGLQGSSTRPSSVHVLSNEHRWHGLRTGGRAAWMPVTDLTLRAKAMAIPLARWEFEDRHPLRTDLLQDPSVAAESNAGYGVDAEVALGYRVWRGLALELGVRYWRMKSGGGDVDFNAVSGTSLLKVHDAVMERYGPFFAIHYRF